MTTCTRSCRPLRRQSAARSQGLELLLARRIGAIATPRGEATFGRWFSSTPKVRLGRAGLSLVAADEPQLRPVLFGCEDLPGKWHAAILEGVGV
jgi:hypothetical protein